MVQGLGFLSKKSWHTKNLNNQEKVWIAEQQQEQERLRTTELAKQIQIEREQNEINDITGGNTNAKKKVYDRGIDWMYTGQTKDSQIAKEDAQKIAEEYLLGKPIAFHGGAGALPVTAAATTTTTFASSIEGSRTMDAVVMKNDNATLTNTAGLEHANAYNDHIPAFKTNHKYEDPMYAVSLQTVRKEKMMEHQKELYHKVGIATVTTRHGDDDVDVNDDGTGNVHKFKKSKAHKKSKKKKRKKYDSDHSEDDDERNHRHRKHSKRPSHDYRERSRTQSKRKRRCDDDDENSYDSRGDGGSNASSYSNDRKQRQSRSRYHDDRTDGHHDKRHHDRDYDNDDRSIRSDTHPPPPPRRDDEVKLSSSRYGLVTKNRASADHHFNRRDNESRTNDLGPDQKLVQRKRDEKYNNHPHHKYHPHSRNSSHRGNTIEQSRHHRISNPEERARALRDMEENARSFDTARRQPKVKDHDGHDATTGHHGAGASFLHEISQQVHGVYVKK